MCESLYYTKNSIFITSLSNHQWRERSFQSSAPRLWNSLPETVKLSKSLNIFKNSLKTHLRREAFCSVYFSDFVMLLSLLVGCSFVEQRHDCRLRRIPALYKCPLLLLLQKLGWSSMSRAKHHLLFLSLRPNKQMKDIHKRQDINHIIPIIHKVTYNILAWYWKMGEQPTCKL